MHFFDSLTFLSVTALGIAGYHLVSYLLTRVRSTFDRNYLLLALSVAGVIYLFHVPAQLVLVTLVFCVGVYLAVRLIRRRSLLYGALLLGVVTLLWAVARFPHFFGYMKLHDQIMPLVGVSFFFCKLVSVIVDECIAPALPGAPERRLSLPQFLVYIFYFPAWLAGPLSKYAMFEAKPIGPGYWSVALVPGIKRIIIGTIKRNLLVNWLSTIALPFIPMDTSSKGYLILGAYAYYAYLYFDFSGYCDTAIGISKIVGVPLPENFDRPYLARNIQDFWNRWHISFTKWLFEYIFVPFFTTIYKWQLSSDRVLLSACAFFVTFLFSGTWHGEGIRFVQYGIYHGFGLFAFRQIVGHITLPSFMLSVPKPGAAPALPLWVARVATFHYVLVGFVLFSVGFSGLHQLVARLVGG